VSQSRKQTHQPAIGGSSARGSLPIFQAHVARPAVVVQRLLADSRQTCASVQDEEQWAAFSNTVLAQMERLMGARSGRRRSLSDPASADRKRTLQQVIATLCCRLAAKSLTPRCWQSTRVKNYSTSTGGSLAEKISRYASPSQLTELRGRDRCIISRRPHHAVP
jgi:hypothetical protein